MNLRLNTNCDQSDAKHSADYAPYPKVDPKDVAPVHVVVNQENSGFSTTTDSQKSAGLSSEMVRGPAVIAENQATTMPTESNTYISASPAPSPSLSVKNTMGSVCDALERWGEKVGEATKNAEDLAGNFLQHLKTAPSVTVSAMGRIAQSTKVIAEAVQTAPSVTDVAKGRISQSTKVLAEGSCEKIFLQTFELVPEEQLQNSYASYLSTSAGPIMGMLYVSTVKHQSKSSWKYFNIWRTPISMEGKRKH